MFRKIAAIFLSVALAMTMPCIPASMADSSAAPGGRTTSILENAAADGLLQGIAGEVKPEENLTRAQMASILNAAFGAIDKAPLTGFTDADTGAWYYGEMAKAVQMGVFMDNEGALNPEGPVTREEAFLGLACVFKLQAGDAALLDGLKDKDSISPDAQGAATALLKAGYIAAKDGYLNPKANVTVTEFLQILDIMVKCYINQEGTYTSVPDGSVMVNVPDVTLKDVVVKGDLILGDGVGDGSVTLDSITVTGRTLIRGGGAHSIKITGGSSLQNIVIARVNGELRVFAEDGTEIGEVFVDGKDDVTIEGNFASVTLASDNVTVTAVNSQIGSASVAGENSRIIVAAGSAVNTLTVDGANATVEVSGTVMDIVVNAGGAAISGEGQVGGVEANANDVVVTTSDTLVTAAIGTSGVVAGARDVPEGTTVNTTPEYDGGTGGDRPAVTSVSPAQGPAAGGATVTITGKYFTGATTVTFGGKAAASYKVISSAEITAVTPAGTPGAAIVAVTTEYGTGSKAAAYTYVAAPAITSVSPNAGPRAGGTAVTITGTGFTGATSVTFGGTAAVSYTVASDTKISAVTPAGSLGAAIIAVTTEYGTGSKAAAYTYMAAPAITSVSPNVGPRAGGTAVTITGAGFTGATSVTIGGTTAASYTVVSDTQITAVTPAGSLGAAIVSVTTEYGTGSKAAAYTYVAAPVITSVSPNAGPGAGGTEVTITGTGFTGATSVTIGGTAAASYTVASDTQITAFTPAGVKGPADVTVTATGGAGTKASAYTYFPIPSITSIGPGSGPLTGGGTVIITGSGFTGATSVTFGGAAVSYTVISDTSITAVLPAGEAGPADVAVTTPGGTKTLAAAYVYAPIPSIASVSPSAGPVSGGAAVTIAGSGFMGADLVTFGGRPAVSYTVNSDTSITAVAPWGDAGMADVTVTTSGGTGTKTAAFRYCPAVNVYFTFPSAGPLSGGNVVSIIGTGLEYATAVTFGGVNALSFLVLSENEIQATVPAGAAGLVDVAVTTPGGTGTASPAYIYIPAPTITFVSPDAGPVSGGTMVNIAGTGLMGATAVSFGGIPAVSFTVVSDTSIMAATPAGTAGSMDVAVTTIGGKGTAAAAFTYIPAPAIASVSPGVGSIFGVNTVTISGSGFTGATMVLFGTAPASSFTVVSDTEIIAVTPAGIPGAADVAVTAAGGTGVKTGGYTFVLPPMIFTLSPASGATAGGTVVVISGVNLTGATAVTFGSTPATSFTANSDTQITATAPAGAAGGVDVTVTTAGGTATAAGAYTYVPAPTAASIVPSSGPETGGNTVIITGTGYTGATSVNFGTAPAIFFTVNSDTQITAAAPAGTGTVQATVSTAGGTSNGVSYTYAPVPTAASIAPSSGPQTGGNTVTITGTGFTGATAVTYGGTPAPSFTVVSDTQITAAAPAGAGTVSVKVTTVGGTSNGVSYTYAPVPTAASIAPSSGPQTGGNTVTITGTGYTGATSVNFGATPATSFTVVSDTQITAVAPAGTGTVSVTVTTTGGTSIDLIPYTHVPVPAVTSINSNKGPETGGNTVTITGTGYTGATSVNFGATPAISFTVNSDTQITAVGPAGTGTVQVAVTTAGGISNGVAYTYVPVPTAASIAPSSGPQTGGNTVTITGTGFTGATAVTFGGTPAPSFTVVSATQITAITPAGTGTVSVKVTTVGGTSVDIIPYTYVPAPAITSIAPNSGPETGGNTVTITGTNLTGATSVNFGAVPVTSFTVDSATQITAVAPAGTGTVQATVTTPGGTSNGVAYTYIPAPIITAVSPDMSPLAGGTIVTITGTYLTGATGVTIGGTPASFTVDSATQIRVVAPAGTGTVAVKVTTSGGTSNSEPFFYIPAPTITTVAPNSGPEAGGTSVTITGTGFTVATAVNFGGAPAASFTINSATQITATAPAGTGTVQATVTTPGGTSNGLSYSYIPAPTITSIVPNSGPGSGGNTVTITGTNLTGATAVNFGSTPATSFTVHSDMQITATAPAGAGTVTATATTAGGTSNGISYTYVPEPVISSAVLNIGPETGGNTVTITGTGYTGTTSVNFGATPATSFTVVSDTEITATAPAGAGTVLLTVTTIGGTSNGVAYTYAPAPVITAIVPNAGPVTGDNTVTITGTGFTWAASVHFGATSATSFTVVSDTHITAVAPAGTGTVSTTVTTAGGTSNGVAYTYVPAPVIDSVEPDKGPAAGSGESVSIYGSCFTEAISVTFGGTPAVSFSASEDWIVAVPPEGTAGKVDVTVTTPYGSATKPDAYTYIPAPAITSVSPDRGPLAGGATVTISGTGFTETTAVKFGSVTASYTVVSDTQIDATAPAGSAGAVSVAVTTEGGTGTLPAAYTYAPAPSVTSVSPFAGPLEGGTTVTIAGSNFTGATSVTFSGVSATSFTVVSDTRITAVTPANSQGTVTVRVTTPCGSGDKLFAFYYAPAPGITSVNRASGPEAGGNSVTIAGSYFTLATSVTFNGLAADFTVEADSWITAKVPAGTGTVSVSVQAPGGTATLSSAYTYIPAPSIASVSPDRGAVYGGTTVAITGSNFTGATSVTFGGTAATSFTVNSDNTITATAPAGAAGTVDVAVTTEGGTGTMPAAFTYGPAPAITSVDPFAGPLFGGTTVTITGSNFTDASSVSFGGVPAAALSAVSDTQITAVTPANSQGSVIVRVTTPYGNGDKSNAFYYAPAPVISSVNPGSGPEAGGTGVTIVGSNFTLATSVTFGGISASYTVDSDTQISAVTPAGSGTVSVTVTTAGGTGTAVDAYEYLSD